MRDDRLTGQELIDFIKENHLEDAKVVVTATMYYQGDHDCRTTDEVSVMEGHDYDYRTKKSSKTIDIYVDSSLY